MRPSLYIVYIDLQIVFVCTNINVNIRLIACHYLHCTCSIYYGSMRLKASASSEHVFSRNRLKCH